MAIIVRVHGGLGNQLFDYAFARAAAKRNNTSFLLDISAYTDPSYDPQKIKRVFTLSHFNARYKLARDSDLFGFIWFRKHYKLFEQFYRMLRGKRFFLPFYYREQTFAYDPGAYALSRSNTYFDGFWQTEKYFLEIADELRTELTLKEPLSPYGQSIGEEIKKTTAVSLHVRRGDYVTDPDAVSAIGICTMEYYEKAFAKIAETVPNPHFFIFSDDYSWSRENFKDLPYAVTCIENRDGKDYEDIALMSMCRHHIISNSTFGWWGAWLNPRTDKLVIAPSRWFANMPKADTKDIIPESWITL